MQRRPRRTPLWAEHEHWTARRDPRGQWRVVNPEGTEPLRDADPIRRLRAAYLVAAAPLIFAVLEASAGRLGRLAMEGRLDERDRVLAQEAMLALTVAHPPIEEVIHALQVPQLELPLEAGEQDDTTNQDGRRRA